MNDAVQEIHNLNCAEVDEDRILKTSVSCDGMWRRRSRHGCVTVISMETGKVLYVEPLSKVRNKFKKNEGKNTTENKLWK